VYIAFCAELCDEKAKEVKPPSGEALVPSERTTARRKEPGLKVTLEVEVDVLGVEKIVGPPAPVDAEEVVTPETSKMNTQRPLAFVVESATVMASAPLELRVAS
jgi:hypothetical protein